MTRDGPAGPDRRPRILDGRALARRLAPGIRERAAACAASRGRPPTLLLLAFQGVGGETPWVTGKMRACSDAGVEARLLSIPHDADPESAVARFREGIAEAHADGVFVQFPFPVGIDGEALSRQIPPEADIDVMVPERTRAYLNGVGTHPPLTIHATLTLLDASGIGLSGVTASVVGDDLPFNRMFVEALTRRDADATLLSPEAVAGSARLRESSLVVTSVGRPGAVPASALAPDSVVVDGGYFNPGGVGDVDLSGGAGHLAALAPVPGGIGPMTVSALVDAVVDRAERTL